MANMIHLPPFAGPVLVGPPVQAPTGDDIYGKHAVYQVPPDDQGNGHTMAELAAPMPLRVDEEFGQLGTTILSATLSSPDQTSVLSMQLFHRDGTTWYNLLLQRSSLSVTGRDTRETVDAFNIDKAQMVPAYAAQATQVESTASKTIEFRAEPGSPILRMLAFKHIRDMFAFQRALTGYTVVHDCAQGLTTCQEARLFGGRRRQDLSRLQIWTAWDPRRKEDARGNTSVPSSATWNSPHSPASQPSLTVPWITEGRGGSSFALGGGSSTIGQASLGPNFAPSIFSGIGSPMSSSNYGLGSPYFTGKQAPLTALIPPSLVFFSQKIPSTPTADLENLTRSFLVVDITPDLTINEEHLPPNVCVIENKAGSSSSYLTARRSLETPDLEKWDIASLGQTRRQAETMPIKKLKHVVIQFNKAGEMEDFKTKFAQVQSLAAIRVAKFLGLQTGDP